MAIPVYLLHPSPSSATPFDRWVSEVKELIASDPDWRDWKIIPQSYGPQHDFSAVNLYARVKQRPGPILLLEPVAVASQGRLRERLRPDAAVHVTSVNDSGDLLGAILDARAIFESDEPVLPLRYVVAMLILKKLHRRGSWGGDAKGYLWSYDIPRGGFSNELRESKVILEVVDDLYNKDVLIRKKKSGSKWKYALNPNRRLEIRRITEHECFSDKSLKKFLMNDKRQVPARLLKQ